MSKRLLVLTVLLAIVVLGMAFGTLGYYWARVHAIPETPATQEAVAPLPSATGDQSSISPAVHVVDLEGVKKLKVGDVVSGMTVSFIVSVPGVTSARPEIAPVTRITFTGQREVRGSYIHFGDVSSDPSAVYDPSHSVVFHPVPPSQLPLGVIDYATGGLCFTNQEVARRAFAPEESSGSATVLIDNYTTLFPVSEGCAQADLIRVVEK